MKMNNLSGVGEPSDQQDLQRPESRGQTPSYRGVPVLYNLITPVRSGSWTEEEEKSSAFQVRVLEEFEDTDSSLTMNGVLEEQADSSPNGTPRASVEGLSRESNSSASSDPRRAFAERERGSDTGYVRVEVNSSTGEIDLIVSSMRPSTYLGKRQGTHITAYSVFVYAILTSVDEQNVQDIPSLLVNMARNFLPETSWGNLEEILKKFNETSKESILSRQERKELTGCLRAAGKTKEQVQKAKIAFIVCESASIAKLVREISEEILKAINQSADVVYAPFSKKSAVELGREGMRIRCALKELHALHKSILGTQSNMQSSDEVDEKTVAKMPGAESCTFYDTNTVRIEDAKKIGKYLADLFDLNYQDYKIFMFFEKLPKGAKKKFEQAIQSQKFDKQKIWDVDVLSQLVGSDCDAETIKAQVEASIDGRVSAIVSQHVNIIFCYAFSGLSQIAQQDKEIIFNTFLDILCNPQKLQWPSKVRMTVSSQLSEQHVSALALKRESLPEKLSLFCSDSRRAETKTDDLNSYRLTNG